MAVVLLVDDDLRLSQMLKGYLEKEGFGVLLAGNGQEMWQQLQTGSVDVIVLDWMLPGGKDGISLIRELRAKKAPPVLMLSARGEDEDRIMGLENGVDDYLAKPFNARELLARLRALLRRQGREEPSPQLQFGPFRLDMSLRRLYLNDQEQEINPAEMELLLVFAQRPRRILSRDTLLQILGGEEEGRFDRSIDVRVTRLRKIIEENPRQPRYLLTERGVGYRFEPGQADS
ncbi:response regulator transcription factor [Candidatus Igneacidithiobacillus taiwanensis]|uniref:response regulator transcription factor n=1 Tax=Candidatus Igneacidithiobacillus taiwanensis TaxID=1945924 RepID=UPI00289DED42|nr:response regulator transcription factor [Candidatus Igneacidithiobacillus taiwanensis]MCE5360595.1 response regulator transcription factor [Acidithiobacillus sp.]